RLLGDVLGAGHRMAEEDLFLVLAVGHGAELVGEAPAGDHGAGLLGGLLDVGRGAGGDVLRAEDQLLGDAAAGHDGDAVDHLLVLHRVAVALGQLHDHAERTAARDDGGLVHRVGHLDVHGDDGVAGLVIGGEALLLLVHGHGLALGALHDVVLGVLAVAVGDHAPVAAGGHQGRLVDQVGQVRAGEAGGAAGDGLDVDVGG